ncbi:MAG: GNAT family N-acetyltransferase [Fimbriimonas sp.]
MDMVRAMGVFLQGFSTTRSFTHPYEIHQVGRLWVLRDAPRPRDERKQEIIVCGLTPEEAQEEIRAYGQWAWVCVLLPAAEDILLTKNAYKAMGYRYTGVQPMMTHDLKSLPDRESPVEIHRVLDRDEADRLNRAAGARQILPHHIHEGNADVRLYVATIAGEFVGNVKSVAAGPDRWVSNMFVNEGHRRQGIGTALLTAMLKDDKSYGIENSVLLATTVGSKLYSSLGYEHLGNLLMFTPRRS